MILVFVTNERIGEVADIVEKFDRVSYRNPKYFKPHERKEKCSGVYIHGDYPQIEELYSDELIRKDSTEYTISELREMKDSIDDWDEFTKNDNRKSISQI